MTGAAPAMAPSTAHWTLGEIAHLAEGRFVAGGPGTVGSDTRISYASVSTDTRTLSKGDLFVALRGENHDAHDHLERALGAGASALFVDRLTENAADAPRIEVDDTLSGWQRWGANHRARWTGRALVAITGSSGKTTAKNALAELLRGAGPVWSTPGNRNNHVGVPWTLLGLGAEHDYAVIEMGMNHAGEISELSRLARPDVALITSVGRAHIGYLGSREAILGAKLEIVDGLPEDAVLVLPHDPWVLERLPESVASRPRITFGFDADADWKPSAEVIYEADGTTLHTSKTGTLRLSLLGPGPVLSVLSALATADALGLDVRALAPRLESLRAEPMRMEPRPWGPVTAIVDCYNASPESTRLAIEFLGSLHHDGRKILVLGELSELGAETEAIHRELVRGIEDIDLVLLVGPALAEIAEEAEQLPGAGHVAWRAMREEASTWLADTLEEGDLVLLKASRRLALERILERPVPGPLDPGED
ncbi:MAG: UDP-N-acetylmuramoyl-tripeptide--D-alanyl-D-alanine ligase [Candidatus Eisenbacteria bacterium]